MRRLIAIEKALLIGHIVSMAFGLAGLLLVLPHPEFVANLPDFGKTAFAWSMAGGGVVYMVLGMAAVAVYAYRTLGVWHWLGFMVPAISLSLCSELLGTSTGFPFGHYRYLSGLGYKIAGLVPFTIPLSWFYLGFSAYIIARVGLSTLALPQWLQNLGAIAIGAVLLTSWDFVLDPAMSQTTIPFWIWEQPGAFFGMPYENFAGWFGTGCVFMTVATLIWQVQPVKLPSQDLTLPFLMYLGNFGFATVMSIGAGIYPPIFLGLLTGILPLILLYNRAQAVASGQTVPTSEVTTLKIPVVSVRGAK
ncbi:MAG: carotenoid biosynthesis protein [Microcystis viridis Mv_BB_P_19951000_S69]|jgi:putative membrane protein|uniref:Carotenoid biosynthesis protein n=1 Tax=Microcystis viridis Mv_BB_P_19951000_S68D TaxID=2486270 RepID=A0A552I9A4_MICVR|nr:carotenoid biosynthesis protein [Microcystis aeruginosa LG13-11]TRU68416.1 MAG: carotenoid biosynthesis protein [Microcystis viridis Mv_BB_P_19951000_S69]TRU68599.1 MAG: carotenoid biosynthesis protein [Microcystis viridis Mv_BB_P_19951000_S68]TRU80017.1 MAG: carotenoid biosynthesis protein [Microcystis viridis Mv_BB_P_19951000_S68D]TRU89252.1 MAG: carotenoid biosynthesis protein [Microcystis viridis Mv_BB_P_19951000_S69D]